MPSMTISAKIAQGDILVSDGAWGTYLFQKGLGMGECPEMWNLDHEEEVFSIARSYIEAGADMVETNSFGGSRFKLLHYEAAERTAEINEAAARISRQAAGDDHWVIGSIGPTGKMLITGEVSEEDLYAAFREQAVALSKGGADAICVETMSDLEEAVIAVKAAKENTTREIICTFTFEKTAQGNYRSMMGLDPTNAAKKIVDAGADIVGTNCGNGMQRMVDIVREIHAAQPKVPILVHANAGIPQTVDGVTVFPESPKTMAALVPSLVKAGASIVGGCCGTTPAHISAIKHAVMNLKRTP